MQNQRKGNQARKSVQRATEGHPKSGTQRRQNQTFQKSASLQSILPLESSADVLLASFLTGGILVFVLLALLYVWRLF
jgi:hypothetical protein